jgi:hypothetical protein
VCSVLSSLFDVLESREDFANTGEAIEYNVKVHIIGRVAKSDQAQFLTDYHEMQGLTSATTSQLQGYQGYDNPPISEETAGAGGGVEGY